MFTRDFDPETGQTLNTQHRRNLVEFFSEPVISENRSEAAGRPIFVDVEMVRIIVPGDARSIVTRRVTAQDKIEYEREYKAFKKGETIASEGTPLEHWGIITRGMARQLKTVNVFTVEQLANLSDEQLSYTGVLGARVLRKQAAAFLEHAKTGQVSSQLVAENERLTNQIASMQAQMSAMNAKFEELLQRAGQNPVDHAPMSANPLLNPIQTSAPPSAEPSQTGVVPANWESLDKDSTLALAEQVTGVKFAKVTEARAAIRESLSA